jgi:hypothetical protein
VQLLRPLLKPARECKVSVTEGLFGIEKTAGSFVEESSAIYAKA